MKSLSNEEALKMIDGRIPIIIENVMYTKTHKDSVIEAVMNLCLVDDESKKFVLHLTKEHFDRLSREMLSCRNHIS